MEEEYRVEIINYRKDAFELIWNHNKEIGRNLSDEELKQGICKFLEKGNTIAVINEGKIIAFLMLYCNSYDTREAYICNLYVLEQYRRKKLAERMMVKAIDICLEKHFKSIHLHVAESNGSAILLYKKLGFCFTSGYRDTDREMVLKLVE